MSNVGVTVTFWLTEYAKAVPIISDTVVPMLGIWNDDKLVV